MKINLGRITKEQSDNFLVEPPKEPKVINVPKAPPSTPPRGGSSVQPGPPQKVEHHHYLHIDDKVLEELFRRLELLIHND